MVPALMWLHAGLPISGKIMVKSHSLSLGSLIHSPLQTTITCYLSHEREKSRIYDQWVREILSRILFTDCSKYPWWPQSNSRSCLYTSKLRPSCLIKNTCPITQWWGGSGVALVSLSSMFHLHVAKRVSIKDPHHQLHLNLSWFSAEGWPLDNSIWTSLFILLFLT